MEIEIKFDKLYNNLNITLIEGTDFTISYMKDYINNGDNLTIDLRYLLIQVLKQMHRLLP